MTGRVMVDDIDARDSVARLRRWVLDHALPLWGEIGFDSARGVFVERLTF
jgi:mannose/cellobiose epimerase-like protein (N-acyl-D-glucosamine 2-epimerase family)